MELWDPGMPPREEAIATLRELETPPSSVVERRRRLRRIPIALLVIVSTILTAAIVAWIVAHAGT